MTGDCWNRIGVFGDRSCPELATHAHCRRCPVYSSAAHALLDNEPDADYVANRTRHFAQPRTHRPTAVDAVLIFRVQNEWLGLPAGVVSEVGELKALRSLPHRRNDVVQGIVNVRGELLACVALGRLLGIDKSTAPYKRNLARPSRMIVLKRDDFRFVCHADEVHGVHRFPAAERRNVPVTVSKALTGHSRAVISWRHHTVGILDEQAIFSSVRQVLV